MKNIVNLFSFKKFSLIYLIFTSLYLAIRYPIPFLKKAGNHFLTRFH